VGINNVIFIAALSPESARWLLEHRGLRAIGEDTISVDNGQQFDWANSVHSVVQIDENYLTIF
jgi:kynurenine formamidase